MELICCVGVADLLHHEIQTRDEPSQGQWGFVRESRQWHICWSESLKVAHGQLGGLPDLVTEIAAGNHSVDVQIDVRTMRCVQEKGKAESIRTTWRNTLWELLILCLLCTCHFLGCKVARSDVCVQILQRNTIHNPQWINDVPTALGHLVPVFVAHKRVQEDILERERVTQLKGEHHHTSHPKEQDVPTSLQQMPWEKHLHVICLLRPAHGRERKQTR
mmetsp:Transcript_42485/g.76201  ORF Transcript_42485/g.76201 Transcript_42485/m.76201 type:complete len:218 (+) Transcript_42485:1108-1761(+)